MQANHSSPKASYRSTTPPLDSSSEDLDFCIDYDLDDLEKIDLPRKPHFLDYDYVPPPGYEEHNSNSTILSGGITSLSIKNGVTKKSPSGEHIKMDKKYELDGEISDSVLAAANKQNNQKLITTSVEEASLASSSNDSAITIVNQTDYVNTGTKKKKQIYAEEIARVAPLYCREREREHRSLDRNFERLGENINLKYERKFSLDRDGPPNFASPRFLDRDVSPIYHRGTWPSDKPNDIQTESSKLGPKVECVYSLLSMLGSNNSIEMSMKFLELSKSPETCIALRRSGCIPLLVQMMHSDTDELARKRAGQALHNVVHCHPDDKVGRREAKVLRLIEQIIEYNEFLKNLLKIGESVCDDMERHPSQSIYSLMKISFDEEHRHAMCQLGALPAIANLVYLDHTVHGSKSAEPRCITLRRYSGMALTNLTFGDGNNKALLCSNKNFMKSLVNQLDGSPEELIQVTACVLRNLSWRADNNIKLILTEIGTVTALTKAAMKNRNENTLKSILSALWNLTAHCSMNKAELCNVEGALAFLADMLVFEAPGKNLSIIENAGGILRNVSSHIAVREDYRKILRQRNCLGILLQQLKSESLTVVSNACGTLWNLSARCAEDQKFLCDNGAVPMLRSLVHSKHKMISNGSNAALKNLLNFKPTGLNTNALDPIAKSMNLKELPSLNMRKQRALEEDLDQNLSETCENIDVVTPPKEEQNVQDFCTMDQNFHHKSNVYLPKNVPIVKSNSKDSVTSLKSTNSTDTTSDESKEEPTPTTSKCFPQKVQTTEPVTFLKYNDESGECDQLTDFSVKYNREQKIVPLPKEEPNTFTVYQETDLDQITDYSLRYAEKHSELEDKHTPPSRPYSTEMILTLEDTVKCYETEGTPYAISNAASMSDLRNHKSDNEKLNDKLKMKRTNIDEISENFNVSGINTPEKPVNYCEEGTPGYFSRRDSISSIDETVSSKTDKIKIIQKNEIGGGLLVEEDIPEIDEIDLNGTGTILPTTPGGSSTSKVVTFEPETPLMFSRHSSIESLSSVEPGCVDDQSSVVSEFSRLASGIISPSELPDSPTQSMPQTPRTGGGSTNNIPRSQPSAIQSNGPPPLRSVFEDDINTFGVENTPAQFSSATSLSNLSLDDEPKISADNLTKDMRLIPHPSEELDEEPLTDNNQRIIENDLKVEDVNYSKENLDSDGEESTNDDILLATCINIGMNRGARNKPIEEVALNMSLNTNDDLIKYCTEGTPAILSKSASNTNLSMLSLETNKEEPALSDDSSNSSDIGNDRLLEECIRDGMKKSSSKEFNEPKGSMVYKENPIAMMRSGGSLLTPYLLNKDETNKFNVEDSPCNFSAMSALSNLTIESDAGGNTTQAQRPLVKNSQRKERHDMMPRNFSQPSADDSLSSLSVDSEEDNNLLSQAIEAGFQSKPKYGSARPPILHQASSSRMNVVGQNEPPSNDPNESFSSIESCESNENQNNSLLEQAIRSGMNRDPKPIENRTLSSTVASTAKKSFLPMFKNLSLLERDKQKDRDKKDEQLLLECINTGMTKPLRNEQNCKPPKIVQQPQIALPPPPPPVVQSQVSAQPQLTAQHLFSLNHQRITQNSDFIPNSKNGQATSVVVSEMKSAPSTTTDVGKDLVDGTNGSKEDHIQHNITSKMQNGFSHAPDVSSNQSINQFLNSSDNLLEGSNEYPALRLSHLEFTEDNSLNNSMDMDMSNEFLIDAADRSSNSQKIDKHKDPDLMLKSVERLTHELVSTAEYLRTNGSNTDDSNTNNTWNEDTCPHDVSFPSISITIPMVESLDDTTFSDVMASKSWILEEITPTNEIKHFVPPTELNLMHDDITRESSMDTTLTYDIPNCADEIQFDSLEPDSGTITAQYYDKPPCSNGINFEVGGEVKHAAFVQSPLLPFGMTTSIIAREAHKVVDHLRNFSNQMTDSVTSLDLEQIRPPSAMDNLSISGYFEMPHSPQLSRNRKKSLPAGLVARRALGHIPMNGGSLESINSSCNLDHIKPPSLMDELLDSMISVASITSEIADSQYDATSLYDTAMSDADDTLALQSALDTASDATPIQSDFSSAESTPRKGSKTSKRSLTPKQKRQLAKDRFRTYTIAADMVLKEKLEEIKMEQQTDDTDDTEVEEEIIKVEIDETRQRLTPRQKRLENRARFETQVLDVGMLGSSSSLEQCNGSAETVYSIKNHDRYRSPTINTNLVSSFNNLINDEEEDASIRAMTERFTYIHGSVNITSTTTTPTETKTITEIINFDTSPNGYLPATNGHLETFTSEAESSLDNEYTSDTSEEFRTFTKPITRIVKPEEKSRELPQLIQPPEVKAIRGGKKAAYVSPYRRTVINNNSKNTSPKHSLIGNTNGRTNLAAKISGDTKKTMKTPASANLIPKNQTVVSKTHVVINKTNLSNKINGLRKNTSGPNQRPIINQTINVTKTTKTTIAVPAPPERQGTFTKDEPTNVDVPVVSSMPTSPSKYSKLPTRATSVSQNASRVTTPKSPAKTFMSKLKIPIQKSASMDADKIAAAQRKPLSKIASPPPSTNDTQKRRSLGVVKSPSVPSVPMRSNSNTSMKNINNLNVNKRNLPITTPPTRSNSTVTKGTNITSKIAGLWKKSDDSGKFKNQKNTVTIKSPEPSPPPPPPPTSKLIRSSTFDSTPEKPINNSPSKQAATGPATSRLTQIASKYRTTTMTATNPQKPQKSPSINNIKNLANGFMGGTTEITTTTPQSKRISRIGTFINGVDD